jgi:cytochrome P450
MGFGVGVFYCLGAALARTEADECFRILLARCPDIRPAAPANRVTVPPFNYNLVSLPVLF